MEDKLEADKLTGALKGEPAVGVGGDAGKLAALEARIAQLEAAAKPAAEFKPGPARPSWDPTERMQMPASAVAAMRAVCGDAEIAGIARSPNPASQSSALLRTGSDQASPAVVPSDHGWRDELRIMPPAGIADCDRLVNQQDHIDRLDLVKKLTGLK
jgi:hypothetical protein